MRVSIKELIEMFCLNSFDGRQIKLGLNNKITYLSNDEVEINDNKLKDLFNEFKRCGSLDLSAVAKKYKCSKQKILKLAEEGYISYFQLVSKKGSKLIFLNSDLEKENEIYLFHVKRYDITYLSDFFRSISKSLMSSEMINERQYEILTNHYIDNLTNEQIGEKYGLSKERVRQIINKSLRLFTKAIKYYIDYKSENDNYKDKYIEILNKATFYENKYLALDKKIKSFMSDDSETIVYKDIPSIYKTKLINLDLSVRTFTVLKSADINTIGDLLEHTSKSFLRYHNFGRKSLSEITKMIHSLGLNFKDES